MERCAYLVKSRQVWVVAVAIFHVLFGGGVVVMADECGTKFTDVISSTFLAQVVLQGAIKEYAPMPAHSRTRSANVTVNQVYKGMDIMKQMGDIQPGHQVVVNHFGTQDMDQCVAPDDDPSIGRPKMFFLRQSSQRRILQLSALPVEIEANVETRVRRSLCPTCVRPPVIKRTVCRKCAREPTIKPIKSRKAKLGRRARLRCAAKGMPAPSISWTKDSLPITSGAGGVIVREAATSSTLVISKAMSVHSGQYMCVAVNPIGRASAVGTLEVSAVGGGSGSRSRSRSGSRSSKDKIQSASDKRPCLNNLCLNGGICYFIPSVDLSYCECTGGFEGVQCENRVEITRGNISSNVSDSRSNPRQTTQTTQSRTASTTRSTTRQTTTTSTTTASRNNVVSPATTGDLSSSQSRGTRVETDLSLGGLSPSQQRNTNIDYLPAGGVQPRQNGTPSRIKKIKRKRTKIPSYTYNNYRSKLKIVTCREKTYCLNGGHCRLIRKSNTKFCQCRPGFAGQRCERQT